MNGFEKAYPHQLSGGMAQRAAIARTLINEPQVLLMDEPLGALDAFTRMHLQDELLKIWRLKKMTTLLVTHDIDEAIYMSTKIVIMSARPSRIETIIDVPQGIAQQRNHPDFFRIRSQILETLNFAKNPQLSYYL